jgi:ABC-type transport system involved in multi-copper enzyme maturation permease subunit
MMFTRHFDYRSKYEDYQQRIKAQEESLEKYAHRNRMGGLLTPIVPPTKMELLVDPAVTNSPMDAGRTLDDNPFDTINLNLDIIALVGLLGSLLALLLSYDGVNREVHEGTIKLLLSTGVPRIKIIIGKILGGSIAALLPIAVIFILAALLLAVTGGWGAGQWVAFLGIFLVSIIYIMLFYCFGAFLSSIIRDQTLSALSCFGLWVLLVIIVPTMTPFIARGLVKVPDSTQLEREKNHLLNVEREDAMRALFMPLVQQGMSLHEALEKSGANEVHKAYHDKAQALDDNFKRAAMRQTKLSMQLACVSPYSTYLVAVEELSGLGFERFQYLDNIITNWSAKSGEYMINKFDEAIKLNPDFGYESKFDMSGAPRFKYTDPGPSYVYSHAMPYMVLLVAYFLIPLFLYLHSFSTNRAALRVVFSVLFVSMFSIYVYSQGAGGQDQATLLYAVKKAEIQVSAAKLDFEAKERLYKSGLVSGNDFEESKNRYQDAKLNYVYSLIRATSGSFYVSVERAVKFQKPDGTKWVRLTLLNSLPDLGKTIDEFLGTEKPDAMGNYKELYNNEIRNVFLSIEKDNVLVGQPLEYKINSLTFGEKRDFDFQIMRDMDEVVICLRYDLQTVERRKVFLMPSSSSSQIILTPENFSVESNLGDKATYSIAVERYLSGSNVVKLNIPDLSPQFQFDIYDDSTRISDINFKENDFKKQLKLNVYLPTRESADVTMDKPIEFHFVASEQVSSGAKIEGKTKLVLIPKGIGKIEVKADNLFQESSGSNPIKIPVKLFNDGSRDILDLSLTVRGGTGWENKCSPMAIVSLKPQAEAVFNLTLTPPENVHPGEYDFKVAIKGQSDGKTVYADEKTFRIKVNPRTNWIVIFLGTALALGLIGGTVYGAIRIMKN